VADAVQRVVVNCVTASNVEVWNEQVLFDRAGRVVTLAPEGHADRHVMGILSVIGEAGTPYAEESEVTAPLAHGRYRYRAGEMEFRPAHGPTGRTDGYAMARLLFCDAERANGMEAGELRRIGSSLANATARVANLVPTRGGCAPPPFADARTRFAELLRTRERVVTAADLEIAVRAFEPRVRSVFVEPAAELHDGALRRVERVAAAVDLADFADPEAEVIRLRAQLQRHLDERCILGQRGARGDRSGVGPVSAMPDFCRPCRGVRQHLDAAVASLMHLGLDAERIVVECAGPGWSPGVVARQEPAPGVRITPRTRALLAVGGAGALDTLPFPLRDAHDGEFRVDRLLALTDNPVLKLGIFLRRAGGFLALRRDDPTVALRWIEEVFQLSSTPWPRELWYSVARLLPTLHRAGGRAEAVPLALAVVFGLPVAEARIATARVEREGGAATRLGGENARLGVDTVLRGGSLDEPGVEVRIGPVPLATYLEHACPTRRTQRDALYHLVLPAHLSRVDEHWAVGDPAAGSRLHDAHEPPVLGVNFYLGAATAPRG
jgi:hypothetical protein